MKNFLSQAANQNHPLRALELFLSQENALEIAKKYDDMRFVGYILEVGYETVTIITSDPFKLAVGGIPRNSLLIMVPANFDPSPGYSQRIPLHFTLLRVLESAPTPLSREVQQTYFELQKKSMPELDRFTQSELQWGALKTEILGMYYMHPTLPDTIEFSGDINNFVSAHKYRIYAPDDKLLDLIINALVPSTNRLEIGKLRLTECRLPMPGKPLPDVNVQVWVEDFKGTRTAMFGKTRLGKSNVVKILAETLIVGTQNTKDVGQLIFDLNGEYANDNPQNISLYTAYSSRCTIYALTQKSNTLSKPLRLNFYEQPERCLPVIKNLVSQTGNNSTYIKNFINLELLCIAEINNIPNSQMGDKIRAIRKLQMYWAILKKAGYSADEIKLRKLAPVAANNTKEFNPGFAAALRDAAWNHANSGNHNTPPAPRTLDELQKELEVINRFRRTDPSNTVLGDTFDADDNTLLEFLEPPPGRSGPTVIQPYRMYHAPNAGDFVTDILKLLDNGETVILDLGNANDEVRSYFSENLSREIFNHQEVKFTNNNLGNHYIQIYFEEAQNLFPTEEDDNSIYTRFAREGAKFHIGIVYSTQSPTAISKTLLEQTENFFVAHLSSEEQVKALARVNVAYSSFTNDILNAKTRGYMRMLTRSHRFVVSVQAKQFTGPTATVTAANNSNSLKSASSPQISTPKNTSVYQTSVTSVSESASTYETKQNIDDTDIPF